MATMKRCTAQLTLSGSWGSEHLWPGLEVNFDRELAPSYTVRDAIAGREDCFEDVYVEADGGPAPADFTHTVVPEGTDFSNAIVRPIQISAAPAPLKDQE